MVNEWNPPNGSTNRPYHGHVTQTAERLQTPPTSHAVFSPPSRNSPARRHSPFPDQRPVQLHQQHPLHRAQYAQDTYPVSPEPSLAAMTQNHILGSNTNTNSNSNALAHGQDHAPDTPNFAQYAHSSFLLDQLDAGYYDTHTGVDTDADLQTHTQTHAHSEPHADFQLDSMEFIAPHNLGHDSRAFPPLTYTENTPALGPADRAALGLAGVPPVVFQSPILPSQNSKSYNQEHLLQKQRHQQQQLRLRRLTPMMHHQPGLQGLEHNFTPLVSPAVTPRELQVNTNQNHYAPAAPTDFEPLTSPALKAQPELDRRRLLAAITGDDYTHGNSAKRRTPHLTPKLLATTLKLKRSPSLRKVPQQYDLNSDPQQQQHQSKDIHQQQQQQIRSSELTPMLPPQGKKTHIEGPQQMYSFGSASTPTSNSSPAPGFGPGMLMGFTMNRLAELQGGDGNDTPSTNSPLSLSQPPGERPVHRLPGSTSAQNSAPNSAPPLTSLSETSPVIEAMTGEQGENGENGSGKRDRFPAKKTSHKIAEQGRRIRMNQAVHDLSRLIPDTFHEGVAVPSKATTIEMAAVYIRNLQQEIESLKNRD